MSSDVDLVCSDCGATFAFTEEEQERYSARGFAQPKRCPACRATRRATRKPQGGGGGGDYRPRPRTGGGPPRRGGGGGGFRPRGGGGGGGYRDREPRQMYSITCAGCGREAEVPFEPSPDRPAYCQDCYRKQRKPSRDY